MEPKRHKVNTLQDMIDCTNENNLDAFLADLKMVISSTHNIQSLAGGIAKYIGESEECAKMQTDGFTWIDDGKNEAKITIGVKSK